MIKIISKKKYENLLDRIDNLTLDIDYLKGENDKLEDQVKIFNEDNKFKENMLERKLDKVKKQKEEIAKLKIELEDTKAFLEQEKACSNALRQEREELRKELDVINSQVYSLYSMFPEVEKFIDDNRLLAEKYDVPKKQKKEKCIKAVKMETSKLKPKEILVNTGKVATMGVEIKKRGRKSKKEVKNEK